jgi:anthraniloyl-CoA monooxygenase
VNSGIRRRYAEHFRPEIDVRHAKYIWLGTRRRFDAFTFAFVENECGVFQAHAYRFDESMSAFIVECDERSWRARLRPASTRTRRSPHASSCSRRG